MGAVRVICRWAIADGLGAEVERGPGCVEHAVVPLRQMRKVVRRQVVIGVLFRFVPAQGGFVEQSGTKRNRTHSAGIFSAGFLRFFAFSEFPLSSLPEGERELKGE